MLTSVQAHRTVSIIFRLRDLLHESKHSTDIGKKITFLHPALEFAVGRDNGYIGTDQVSSNRIHTLPFNV